MTQKEAEKMATAIHRHCLDCSGGCRKEVEACPIKDCPLWPYRKPEISRGPTMALEQLSMFGMVKA